MLDPHKDENEWPSSHPHTTPFKSFNLLVAGQSRTGKSAFINLLLQTSPLANSTNLASLAEFSEFATTSPTNALSFVTAELPPSSQRPHTVLLNLVDSPGLQFHDPQELEKGVDLLLRQITDSFAASHASQEADRADKQMHLCLYFLDPDDIVPSFTRQSHKPNRYGVPTKPPKTRSHPATIRSTIPHLTSRKQPGGGGGTTSSQEIRYYDEDPEDEWGRATVPKAELRVIRRLAEFITVVPVIAKADSLSVERLDVVKAAVRRDMHEAGLTFGMFEPPGKEPSSGSLSLPPVFIAPDRFHHGDGVQRLHTRPSQQQLMAQYQAACVSPGQLVDSGNIIQSQPGWFSRSYRWATIDVLNPAYSDFLALREAILGSHFDTIRNHTLNYYYGRYKLEENKQHVFREHYHPSSKPLETALLSPEILPRHFIRTRHSSPSFSTSVELTHAHREPESPSPISPTYNPTTMRDPSAHYPRVPPLVPAASSMNRLVKSRSVPGAMLIAFEEKERTPMPPVQIAAHPPRPRIPRKIAVACNFCRSRKLKCDGGKPHCQQCVRRKVDCEYEVSIKRRGLGKTILGPTSPTVVRMEGDAAVAYERLNSKAVACRFCRTRKTKCDGNHPRCSNCEKRDQECIYNYPPGLLEEGSSPETQAVSSPSTQLPPIQTLPPGTSIPVALPPGTMYWHPGGGPAVMQAPPSHQSLARPGSETRPPLKLATEGSAEAKHERSSSSSSSNGGGPSNLAGISRTPSGKRKAHNMDVDEPSSYPALDSPPKRRRLSEADQLLRASSSTASIVINRPLSAHLGSGSRSSVLIPVSGLRNEIPAEEKQQDMAEGSIAQDRRTSRESIATTPPHSSVSGHGAPEPW